MVNLLTSIEPIQKMQSILAKIGGMIQGIMALGNFFTFGITKNLFIIDVISFIFHAKTCLNSDIDLSMSHGKISTHPSNINFVIQDRLKIF